MNQDNNLLARFGVSMEKELVARFDEHIARSNYPNRSEAIRDLIRAELVKKQWRDDERVAGVVTIVYDHHKRKLAEKILDIQHDYQREIISVQHIHLDHDTCLEILAVRGRAKKVVELANLLKSSVGVKHSTLSISAIGRDLG